VSATKTTRRISVFDTTLREGEQAPGNAMTQRADVYLVVPDGTDSAVH